MFEQPNTPPEPTPRQIEDAEATERRIEDTVYTRMLDPDYVIDALSVLITVARRRKRLYQTSS